MSANHDIAKLDDLIVTTIDSIRGYEHSAEKAPESRLAPFFKRMAAERRDVVAQLQAQSRALGGTPTEHGSTAAHVRRGRLAPGLRRERQYAAGALASG